jgi:hypothetical protein
MLLELVRDIPWFILPGIRWMMGIVRETGGCFREVEVHKLLFLLKDQDHVLLDAFLLLEKHRSHLKLEESL